MIKKIAFTMYPVRDMARARKFYEQDLGLKMTVNYRDEWIEYDLAGGCFALTSMVRELKASATSAAIAFEVDDVDGFTQALRNKGASVTLEPMTTPVCRMSVVLDPDGNSVILHHVTE